MGTRGLAGFILDHRIAASYNHFDSYPSELGVDVLTFARGVLADEEGTRALVRALVPVQDSGTPTPKEAEHLRNLGIAPAGVSTGDDWYAWLRDNQGNLDAILRTGYFTDDRAFLEDGLFCEWAYLVDLDERMLRVYAGGHTEIASYPLAGLPDSDTFVLTLDEH